MARIREEIYLVENVGAGKRCVIRPAVGRTWLDVHIEHANITLAQMTNIKIIAVSPTRSVTLAEFKDGTELDKVNKYYKRKTEAGTLSVYFRRPELEDEAQRMTTALGTGGLQQFRIEFDIAVAAVGAAVLAWGRKTANRHIGAGFINYVVNHNQGGNAQGDNHYDAIEKRDRIACIHVLNDKVDSLELRVDDATAHKLTRARSDFDQTISGDSPRVPYVVADGMALDFLQAGVLDEALPMQANGYQAQQMRLTTTLGAAPSAQVRYLVEYLTTWDMLTGASAAQAPAF